MSNKYYKEWLEYQKDLNSTNLNQNKHSILLNRDILSRSIDKIKNQEDVKRLFDQSNNYQKGDKSINFYIIIKK
jgi:hypothetical protein